MPMVGQVLRRARERDGLSLEELSRRTKIKVRLLEAIENNDFAGLPGGIFTRGFLRTYAREVAMDPEAIVGRYLAQSEPIQLFPPVAPEPEPRPGGQAAGPSEGPTRPAANRYRHHLRLVVGLALLTMVSVYFGSFRQPHPAAVEASNVKSAPDVPTAVGTSGSSRDVELTAAEASSLKVDLTPRASCWIAATADGKPALARLMNVEDPYRIEAREEVTLRVGDPGALAIAVNGVPGRPLGQPGMPVTVRITRQNYRDFIVRP